MHGLPDFLQWLAEALPLTHLLDAMRSVLIDGGVGRDELAGPAGRRSLWGVGGVVVALRTFRWEPRGGVTVSSSMRAPVARRADGR